MRTHFTKIGKALLFLTPGILGLIGLGVLAGEPFADALFSSVSMYVLNYDSSPPNMLVEAARWTAPLSAAGGILWTFSVARGRIRNYLRYRGGKSVAVYGSETEKAELLAHLGRNGIDGGTAFVRAQRYILVDDERRNLDFFYRYREDLRDASVYIKCRSIQAQSVFDPRLHFFCPEETAARLFWKRRSLFELSRRYGHRMRIVFLGFGKLGEELLTYALQDNIFSPDQQIEYHIFGDGARFTATHTQLDAICDPVLFHSEPWYENLSLLERAHAVIVLTQDGQLSLLRELLLATSRDGIDVFAEDPGAAGLLAEQNRLTLFSWKQEAMKPEHIFSDTLILLAKQVNLHYAGLYDGVEKNRQNLEAQWQKLDSFARYSNISTADYHEIRLRILAADGQPADPDRISSEYLEELAELEHIRWSRYHYLNNWRYGIPPSGARKDEKRRIHADLLPYGELSESEKEKDRENVRLLLSMGKTDRLKKE